MAHKDAATADHKSTSKTQPPKTLELQTSIPDGHISSSKSPDNNSRLSSAELYIKKRSQMLFDPNDLPSETSSTASSTTPNDHAGIMHEWREQKINEIYKNQPYRYQYGTSSSKSSRANAHEVQNSNSQSSENRRMKK